MSASPFTYRMLYASSHELIDYAKELGMNWVVVASSGHTGGQQEDDPPVYMPAYKKLQRERKQYVKNLKANRARVAKLIAHAKRLGLKVIYHSYEPSMPNGMEKTHPELYSKEISEYYKIGPRAVRANTNLCVAQPEVREAIACKVEEICRTFPEIDGFSFTNNETSSHTKVWHRCDRCKKDPFAKNMRLLHDAIRDGLDRTGRKIELFNRCWGTHETDFNYYHRFVEHLKFGVSTNNAEWLKPYVQAFKPAGYSFKPSRDIPQYLKRVEGEPLNFIYKATWGDTNLHHPLNPHMGKYHKSGHDEICEFSFEYCRDAPRVFYIMGKEMQRRARLCARKGVKGVCAVPVCWGMHDNNAGSAHPSKWSLAELNMPLFKALALNPDANLQKQTEQFLKNRYGQPVPALLATLLLDSEDVAAEAMNINGIAGKGHDFRTLHYSLLRYGPMRKNWRSLLKPTEANRKKIFATKDRAIAHAQRMVDQVEALRPQLPKKAYDEFRLCFGSLLTQTRRTVAAHKSMLMLWAVKDGLLKPSAQDAEEMFSMMSGGHPGDIN